MKLRNPFPGIRPFREEENEFFFGRDHQISELSHKLNIGSFVAVVGTSGCGKSSLVRAGLAPRLRQDGWQIAVFRPQDPIENLRTSLEKIEFSFGEENTRDEFRSVWLEMIQDNLIATSNGIVETYKQAGSDKKLIIIVDQFEELFAYQKKGGEARENAIRFINLLIAAVSQKEFPIYVMLTLRSDQLGRCSEFKGLPEVINDGLFLVPRLTRDQYREAIVRPLHVQQIKMGSNLVSHLLNDIEDDPDQLPVLQHSLMITFERWLGTVTGGDLVIEQNHYLDAGGMTKSIDAHCTGIFEDLKNKQLALPVEIIFQRLTAINQEGVETRSPASLQELVALTGLSNETIFQILDAFRKDGCNFLMPALDVPLTANTTVDLSHECIMRKWNSLHKWILKEEENKRFLKRLEEHFENYMLDERGPLKKPTLSAYMGWEKFQQSNKNQVIQWAKRYTENFNDVIGFIRTSIRWESRKKRLKWLLYLLTPFVVSMIILYVDSYVNEIEYQKEKQAKQDKLDSLQRDIDNNLLMVEREQNQKLILENKKLAESTAQLDSILSNDGETFKKLNDAINSIATLKIDLHDLRLERNRLVKDLLESQEKLVQLQDSLNGFNKDFYAEEIIKNKSLLEKFAKELVLAQRDHRIDSESVQLLLNALKQAESGLEKVVKLELTSIRENTIEVYTKQTNGQPRLTQFNKFLADHGYTGGVVSKTEHPSFFKKEGSIQVATNNDSFLKNLKKALKNSAYNRKEVKEITEWRDRKPSKTRSIIVLDFD